MTIGYCAIFGPYAKNLPELFKSSVITSSVAFEKLIIITDDKSAVQQNFAHCSNVQVVTSDECLQKLIDDCESYRELCSEELRNIETQRIEDLRFLKDYLLNFNWEAATNALREPGTTLSPYAMQKDTIQSIVVACCKGESDVIFFDLDVTVKNGSLVDHQIFNTLGMATYARNVVYGFNTLSDDTVTKINSRFSHIGGLCGMLSEPFSTNEYTVIESSALDNCLVVRPNSPLQSALFLEKIKPAVNTLRSLCSNELSPVGVVGVLHSFFYTRASADLLFCLGISDIAQLSQAVQSLASLYSANTSLCAMPSSDDVHAAMESLSFEEDIEQCKAEVAVMVDAGNMPHGILSSASIRRAIEYNFCQTINCLNIGEQYIVASPIFYSGSQEISERHKLKSLRLSAIIDMTSAVINDADIIDAHNRRSEGQSLDQNGAAFADHYDICKKWHQYATGVLEQDKLPIIGIDSIDKDKAIELYNLLQTSSGAEFTLKDGTRFNMSDSYTLSSADAKYTVAAIYHVAAEDLDGYAEFCSKKRQPVSTLQDTSREFSGAAISDALDSLQLA